MFDLIGLFMEARLKGTVGGIHSLVRGEILGFMEDEQVRKHLPRMFSLIKNES